MKVPSKEGTFLYALIQCVAKTYLIKRMPKKKFNIKHIFLLFDFKMLRLN
ncbi:hypothetical protein IGI53_001078 [Enterococcus sp. DIV0788_1]